VISYNYITMPVSSLDISQLELPEALEFASKEIDGKIIQDSKLPILDDQLNIHNYASLSGITDKDYPIAEQHGCDLNKHLTSLKRVPLPDELIELYSQVECNAVMGIFAELNRAWVSIDSDLYLWRYEDGSDLAFYDGLKEAILAASLVVPKPGVFQEHIRYLLCITTANFITISGVCFSQENTALFDGLDGAIQLLPEPLFTISSDRVYLTSICGTTNGRIFLSGKDNCLYEIIYNSHRSWFGKQCYKVNHSLSKMNYIIPSFLTSAFSAYDPICQLAVDNSRGLLYCRTEQGNVKLYNLGENLDSMSFVTMLTSASASKQAQCIARTIISTNFDKIIHIAPIPKNHSNSINMVAITNTGVRLYFMLLPGNDLYGNVSQMRLAHVRMPPGFSPGVVTEKPSNIRTAFYRKGVSLLVAGLAKDFDVLWCFSQDMFPLEPQIRESQCLLQIDSEAWSVAEIANDSLDTSTPQYLFSNEFKEPPAVVTQHILPPRKFVLLSTDGSHIITLARPLEQLRLALYGSKSGESDGVATFFRSYGLEQACATCLALVCQTNESELQLAELAVSAFFHYGGKLVEAQQPQGGYMAASTHNNMANSTAFDTSVATSHMSKYIVGSPIQGGSSEGSYLSTPIGPDRYLNQPTPAPPNLLNSTMMNQSSVTTGYYQQHENAIQNNVEQNRRFSPKYHGLLLYFSRIVRPIWNFPMVGISVDAASNETQVWSRLCNNELSWFIEEMKKLKGFMEKYTEISGNRSPHQNSAFYMTKNVVGSQEVLAEKKALQAFSRTMVLSIEALELWRILTDHQFHTIVNNKDNDLREKLLHINFRDMFSTTGRELSCSLINLLMAKYLNDSSTVESLSSKLREVCPTIFSEDDAIYAKANELLMAVHLVTNQREKDKLVQEAILAYSKVAHLVDLEWTCRQLKINKCYTSLVHLCLTIALKRDSKGIALYFFKSGKPNNDLEGVEVYNYRRETYDYILKALEELLHTTKAQLSSPMKKILQKEQQQQPTIESLITQDEAMRFFEEMLSELLTSGDELSHVVLYDWLIMTSQTDRFLQIKSPYIEQYLIATAAEKHPVNRAILDLLWKYYEKNDCFMEAAQILTKLAEREESMLIIHDRIEYLSRAVMSCKSCRPSASSTSNGEFLHETEEKLEVARIQLLIYDHISKSNSIQSNRKDTVLMELNSKLFDISTLYEKYAVEFSLSECKLAIIYCANHGDKNLVEKIWQEIIEEVIGKNSHLATMDQMQSVFEHLSNVMKTYIKHEQFFPLDHLLFALERKCCEGNWDASWVINLMLDAGVNTSVLFHQYHKIYRLKDKTWQMLGKPFHILTVISKLMENCLENLLKNQSERYILARSLFEAVTSYLVDLEAMHQDPNVQMLLSKYKSMQGRLKRIL